MDAVGFRILNVLAVEIVEVIFCGAVATVFGLAYLEDAWSLRAWR